MLELFGGDPNNQFVALARENLEAELQRLEALKTPQERVKDLDIKLVQIRNAVGNKAMALDRAHQEAQAAQEQVEQLEAELQAALEEAQRLEIQQDQLRADMPRPDPPPQTEPSAQERDYTTAIQVLMRMGDTSHVQQCLNELQYVVLRLGSERHLPQSVLDDNLEHGLDAHPPWPPQEGSLIRETIITRGSLATQRHVQQLCKSKGKGGAGKHQHKGKGKGPSANPRHAEEQPATSTSTPPPSSTPKPSTPSATESAPPWRPRQQNIQEEDDKQNDAMDEDPQRGAKRPADSEPAAGDKAATEEDEFQEAARYRRGDGHLA